MNELMKLYGPVSPLDFSTNIHLIAMPILDEQVCRKTV